MVMIPIQNKISSGIAICDLTNETINTKQRSVQNRKQQRTTKQIKQPEGILLQKGQKVNINTTNDANLDCIEVGLGWDLSENGKNYDLDVEAFLLGENGKVLGDEWFVFYNQKVSPDGAVICGNDNRTGEGDGDDETIQIQLSKLHHNVNKIVFIVTINEALQKGYRFNHVKNAYVRIVNKMTGKELLYFRLTDYYDTVCSMVVGELYQHKGQWKFNAVGNGTAQDLEGLCVSYGVNVVD